MRSQLEALVEQIADTFMRLQLIRLIPRVISDQRIVPSRDRAAR